MNVEYVSVQSLKPHPRNKEFFKQMQGDDWERFVRDIRENGIRDPLKVTREGTIIGGEQRWLASQEVGLEEVPIVYQDVSEQESFQLLLLDNLSRRHLTPIEKAKVASILKEEWGVKAGNNEHNNENGKSVEDIAEAIGESKRTTQRLMKLNDLIPELKVLVEEDRLRQTSAETLAHLEKDEQLALYRALGESIAQKTVQETKELRKAVELERPNGGEGEPETTEDVQNRVESILEKQKMEYEQKLLEEQHKTETAMSMVTRLETELELMTQNNENGENSNEIEQQLLTMRQQLVEAQERARIAEIQKKELEATGSKSNGIDAINLGMWKQVSVMIKQLMKEDTENQDILAEIEDIQKRLQSYMIRCTNE